MVGEVDKHIKQYKEGSARNEGIICIHLDLKHGEIKFLVNGVDHGIAVKNITQRKNVTYCLAVRLYYSKATAEIIHFRRK